MGTRSRTAELGVEPPVDFSYGSLRRIYRLAARRFELRPLGAPLPATPSVIVRHDIDIGLEHAIPLAELEAQLGIRASYLVMTDSDLYELDDDNVAAVRRLAELGHELGVHVDVSPGASPDSAVRDAARRLAALAGVEPASCSFHRPAAELLRGPDLVGGLASAYAAPLMRCYLSDSAGSWRQDPIRVLSETGEPVVQLLVHPVWWGPEAAEPPDRLESLYDERTVSASAAERERLDRALHAALEPAVRRGLLPE